MRRLVTLLSLFLTVYTKENEPHWTYSEGPIDQDNWYKQYPDCGGKKQSPINIQTDKVRRNTFLENLQLISYGPQKGKFLSVNNGHSIQVSLSSGMHITKGLPYTFQAVQMHLHWGGQSDNIDGSEHTINGVRFPCELHIVHFNSEKYSSYDEAKDKPDGLAVIAVLIKAEKGKKNSAYKNIFSHLSEIQKSGQSFYLNSTDVQSLLPQDFSHYYRYNGSLTTPPCTENVYWIVLANHPTISLEELNQLETTVHDGNNHVLQNNFRKTQALNGRVVEANFSPEEARGKRSKPHSRSRSSSAESSRHHRSRRSTAAEV